MVKQQLMTSPSIKRWHQWLLWGLYVAISGVIVYYIQHDIKDAKSLFKELDKKVEKAQAARLYHPYLFGQYHEYMPYVHAIHLINLSKDDRFWLAAHAIDPTINLNYFVYPKEIRMTVDTQFELYSILLDTSKMPAPIENQAAPKKWDKKIVVRQTARIEDK